MGVVNHPGQEIARFCPISVFSLLIVKTKLSIKSCSMSGPIQILMTSKPSPGMFSLLLSWAWGRICGLGMAVLGSGVISVGMVMLGGWDSSLS